LGNSICRKSVSHHTKSGTFTRHTKPAPKSQPCKRACLVPTLPGHTPLPFKGQYNFRPGFMKPFKEQKNVKAFFKPFIFLYPKLFPGSSLAMQEVGRAMIKTVTDGYRTRVLEVKDIKELAG